MGLSYFGGKTWDGITREERVFCAELFQVMRANPNGFVRFLNRVTKLDLNADVFWDVGYEVCFYRDLLHYLGKPKRESGLSLKRTFDLCLFSEDVIVVIEAKAHQLFTTEQGKSFANDAKAIERLIGSHPKVLLVALASSRYYQTFDAYGQSDALRWLDARLSWNDLKCQFDVPLFGRAEEVYGQRGPILSAAQGECAP